MLRLRTQLDTAFAGCHELTFREITEQAPPILTSLLPAVHTRTTHEHDVPGGLEQQEGFTPAPHGGLEYTYTYTGPPEPLRFSASGFAADAHDQALTVLFFSRLDQLLRAAGYREALELQARRDWLTGLPVQQRLEASLNTEQDRGIPSAVLAVRLPAERQHEGSRERRWRLRDFAHSLRLSLPDEGRAYLSDQEIILIQCPDREIPHAESLVRRLEPGAATAYAVSGEAAGKCLINLACSRLDGWRTGIKGRPAPWAQPAQAPVAVHCRVPVIRRLLEQRTAGWHFQTALTLLADFPRGSALRILPELPGSVVVLTDCTSVPYLNDLADCAPAGLIAGTGLTNLRPQLERIAAGEQVYTGPFLEPCSLFPRERQVWQLLAYGYGNAEIARQLHITERTAANYYSGLRDKLQLSSRHAVALHYWGWTADD